MTYIGLEIIAEDVMGGTQHDDIGVIVAKPQKPVSDQISCFLRHLRPLWSCPRSFYIQTHKFRNF